VTRIHLNELAGFVASCEQLGVTIPPPIIRASELIEIVDEFHARPTTSVLDLSDEHARAWVMDYSVREHDRDGKASGRGMAPGIFRFKDELSEELFDACRPHLDQIVTELQPHFDEITRPLVVAAQTYGFTNSTTSDQVIELSDEDASAAWRGARRAWQGVAPIAAFRLQISRVFGLRPTHGDQIAMEGRASAIGVNQSVCFAAGENWSIDSGYYIEGRSRGHLDWLALAAGGLHLNTPSEVEEKLDGRRSVILNRPGPKVDIDAPLPTLSRRPRSENYPTYRQI
jgi:hypothetical protein